ncbi:hypothetical protein K2173_010603 [Erythroxylum novogranatense]|uniref:peptidylprolyl isomerase n=1 Tax=Erythroxylum novogranatense TaxID=1862640 RepID=A0AAV8TE29_9ROSI|nr:hypothetical protein K2173_010603 [Erythroxylum novogranatense]
MEATPLHTSLRFRCPFQFPCGKRPKVVTAVDLHEQLPSLTGRRLPRRVLLNFISFKAILLNLQPVIAAPRPEMKEPEVVRTVKLESGVWIQEIVQGQGPEAHEGDVVEVNYVCRRSNGYFVHSTVDQFNGESSPVILPLDEKQVTNKASESFVLQILIIKGLKEVLVGMKVGGKRRALIPPSVGYVNENLKPIPDEFGHRRRILSHADEPLIFEVKLMKLL